VQKYLIIKIIKIKEYYFQNKKKKEKRKEKERKGKKSNKKKNLCPLARCCTGDNSWRRLLG
jgi:hypothetical protein